VARDALTVVVTGASGFLGRRVTWSLRERDIDCVGVARRPAADTVTVASYEDTPRGDVLVHLAESADQRAAETGGPEYLAAAAATLSALLEKGFGRVVYASSAVVYGDRSSSPRGPGDPVVISDAYSRLKRDSELAVLGQEGVVVRLSNLYGPGMSSENVVSAVLRQIPGEGPVRVRDCTPIRDYVWIDDAADALATMALARPRGVYNVGTGCGTSVGQLAEAALDIAGESDRPILETSPSGRSSQLVLDVTLTTEAFGWRPRTALRDGLTILMNGEGEL
jgi:UDP-glucose 4-epimerase